MRAAIDARQDLDVLRENAAAAANKDEQAKLQEKPKDMKDAVAKATKDPMASDAQLSAALLILRMQLAGAQALRTRVFHYSAHGRKLYLAPRMRGAICWLIAPLPIVTLARCMRLMTATMLVCCAAPLASAGPASCAIDGRSG